MKQLELSNYKVELRDSLTWLQDQRLQASFVDDMELSAEELKQMKGDITKKVKVNLGKVVDRNITAISMCITKITDKEGNEVAYSEEWLGELSREDGAKLAELCNQIASPKE